MLLERHKAALLPFTSLQLLNIALIIVCTFVWLTSIHVTMAIRTSGQYVILLICATDLRNMVGSFLTCSLHIQALYSSHVQFYIVQHDAIVRFSMNNLFKVWIELISNNTAII